MERKSIVDQIEITRGCVQIRIAKLIVDANRETLMGWHRTSVNDSGLAAATMDAVNQHLVQMGEAPLGDEDTARLVLLVETALSNPSPYPLRSPSQDAEV